MTQLHVHDKVIVITDWSEPSSMRAGTIVSISSGECVVNFLESGKQLFMRHCVFPYKLHDQAFEILCQRKALKDAYDDSMKLVYELINSWKRGEIV